MKQLMVKINLEHIQDELKRKGNAFTQLDEYAIVDEIDKDWYYVRIEKGRSTLLTRIRRDIADKMYHIEIEKDEK